METDSFIFDADYCVRKNKNLRFFNIPYSELKNKYIEQFGYVDCVDPDFDVSVYSVSANKEFKDTKEAYTHWLTIGRKLGLIYCKNKDTALKVILTTKDDEFLIETWVRYYLNLVGKQNIIICDNGSTSSKVLAIYEKYDVLVYFVPEYPPDRFKQGTAFPDFYEQVYLNSLYSINVDTDEFLCFYDVDKPEFNNSRISAFLRSLPDSSHTLTTSWLFNNYYHKDYEAPEKIVDFGLSVPAADIIKGKSIFRSNSSNTNHSHNAVSKNLTFCPELVLLHLDKANIEARVKNKIAWLRQNYKELSGLTDSELIEENAKRMFNGSKVDHVNRQVYEYHKNKEEYLDKISTPSNQKYISTNIIAATIKNEEAYFIARGESTELFKIIFNAFLFGYTTKRLHIKNLKGLTRLLCRFKNTSLRDLPRAIMNCLSQSADDQPENTHLNTCAVLKVMLKTKNESFLLEPWLLYHSNLVGWENLIVLDNGSTDLETLDIYKKYADKPFTLLSYTGAANSVHNIKATQILYDVIRYDCKYLCFLDTDEYIAYYDQVDGKFNFDSFLTILKEENVQVAGSTWIHNTPKKDYINIDNFENYKDFELNPYKMTNNFKCGKPVVSSSSAIFNISERFGVNLCHNKDVPNLQVTPGLIIFHLDKTNIYTRIKSNFSLLYSRMAYIDELQDYGIKEISLRLKDLKTLEECFLTTQPVPENIHIKYESIDYHKLKEILSFLKNKDFYIAKKANYNCAHSLHTSIIQHTINPATPYEFCAVYKGKKINNLNELPFLFPNINITARLSSPERLEFISRLSACTKYYEVGAGGTTLLAAGSSNVIDMTVVEADKNWCDMVKAKIERKDVNFVHINYSHGAWSAPTDKTQKHVWEEYSKYIQTTNNTYDLIFIDGRFRVACAAASYNYLTAEGYLMVHDFVAEKRKSYAKLYEIYDLVSLVDSLAVFTKKLNKSQDAEKMWELFKHNWE
jgi:hypothetical protein